MLYDILTASFVGIYVGIIIPLLLRMVYLNDNE